MKYRYLELFLAKKLIFLWRHTLTDFHDFGINGKGDPTLYHGTKQSYFGPVNFKFIKGVVTTHLGKPCYKKKKLVRTRVKGTNGRQKTYEIFHVYCIFYSGFMCQTTVIFGITKDRSLVLNTLASWNCFTCRNLFQNGANDMSQCLTFETAFCKKAQNFV